jgi:hypothetical protein
MTTLIPKIDFKNGGTTPVGAINRPINLKLEESVSVKDFGAVGDGTTDDAAAFLACWTYLYNIGGGTMFIPAGTYGISSFAPVWNSFSISVNIIGSGKYATKLVKVGGAATPVFDCSNGFAILDINSTFSGFSITGNATATALRMTNCARFTLSDIELTTSGAGIGFDNRGSLTFNCENVDFRSNLIGYQQAVYNSVHCNLITFNNGSVVYNSTTGIKLDNGSNIEFNNVDFEVNGTAGNLTTGAVRIVNTISDETSQSSIVFNGCWFERNSGMPLIADYNSVGLTLSLQNVKAYSNTGAIFASIGQGTNALILNNLICNDNIATRAYTTSVTGCTLGAGALTDLGTDVVYIASIINGAYVTYRSVGNLKVNTTTVTGAINSSPANTTQSAYYAESPTSYVGINYYSNSLTAAGTGWYHFAGFSSNGTVNNILIFGNGNVQNANNSYGAISDVTLKENIVDATPKLDDLSKVQIRHFNLKSDEAKTKQIGVIAQELETIFPAMIETDENGIKGVKYSIFVPMLIKAIQELKTEIDTLKAGK